MGTLPCGHVSHRPSHSLISPVRLLSVTLASLSSQASPYTEPSYRTNPLGGLPSHPYGWGDRDVVGRMEWRVLLDS